MATDSKHIQIKVVRSEGEAVTFRVKPTTKFSKIIKAFCQKEGVDEGSVRFMFDGERLLPDGTPAAMEMEDGDQVDVTNVAVGGAPTV